MGKKYAPLVVRVKAMLIDSLVVVGMLFAASEILALFDNVPNFVRVILFVFIFILYEPIFVSLQGQTLGHSFMKICVRKEENHAKKISLPMAILRFLCKGFLGWISLLTISSNSKKQAIHDGLVNSVVLIEE